VALLFDTADHIATLTINRPEAMNAMDPETYDELSRAWIEVRDNPDIWVAVITGAGDKAFTAGADLKKTIPRRDDIDAWHFWQTQEEQILNRGLEVWKPVIAAVNGYCLAGGMTLLFATDIRVAAEHARFGIAEVKRGILPGNGGTQRALRQLPYAVAMELLLLGDMIDAQEAHRIGLVNKVVPADQVMPVALDYARRLCENAPLAVRAIKELAVRSQGLPLHDGLRLEQAIQRVLQSTEDAKEGPRAFAEKRRPQWKGR
jgi:E-phenylitaconyl-CoA hydratase